MFPYAGKVKTTSDQKMMEFMQKEVSKGPLQFSPVVMKPLRNAVKNIAVDDDFKKRLRERSKKRK